MSPIDLIPDFIPVLGYLDDIIIVPLGIALAIRLIPPHLMNEFREAASRTGAGSASFVAAAAIIGIWLLLVAAVGWLWLK